VLSECIFLLMFVYDVLFNLFVWCCTIISMLLSLDGEVDGETLCQLTETMISRLVPTIRLQVKLMNLILELKSAASSQPQPGFSGVVTTASHATDAGSASR